MSQENETYLKHLRAQLSDLKANKSKFAELQDLISEVEQNYLITKQEKEENEAQLEESIKTHTKILEGIKSENAFMLKNLMDKQILNENSFQILNTKKEELKTLKEELISFDSQIQTLNRSTDQTENRISAGKLKLSQLGAEKTDQFNQITELRENLKVLNDQMTDIKMKTIEREKDCLIVDKKKLNLEHELEEKKEVLRILNNKLEGAKGGASASKDLLESKTREIKEIKQLSTLLSNEFKELSQKLTQEIDNNRETEGYIIR